MLHRLPLCFRPQHIRPQHIARILCFVLLASLLSACVNERKQNGGSASTITQSSQSVAYNERIFIPFVQDITQPLSITLDGQTITPDERTSAGVLVTIPNDTAKVHRHYVLQQGASHHTHAVHILSQFYAPRITLWLEGMSEAELRALLEAEGMRLISYQTSSDGGLAVIELGANSHKQALRALGVQSQQMAAAGVEMVSGSDFSYKPVINVHSLDPSCQVWPHIQHTSVPWQPLYVEPEPGQASLWKVLGAEHAWQRGLRGEGTVIYLLDSLDRNGHDVFDCNDTSYPEMHGTYPYRLMETLAPGAVLQPHQVCDENGACSTTAIVRELLKIKPVLETGQRVIVSLSLSGAPHPDQVLAVDDVLYHTLAQLDADYDNLLVVASGGNNGLDGDYHKNTPRLPSGLWNGMETHEGKGQQVVPLGNMLSVSSVGLRSGSVFDGIYEDALYNPNVPFSVSAPSVRLCFPHPDGGCLPDGGDQGVSGSSFATPLVAAAAALYWQACPDLTGRQLAAFLPQNPNADMNIISATPALSAVPIKPCPQTAPELRQDSLELLVGTRYDLRELVASDHPEALRWHVSKPELASIEDDYFLQTHALGSLELEVYHPDSPSSRSRVQLRIAAASERAACVDPPYIPDAALRERMQERWGELSCANIAQQTRLFAMDAGITNLQGLEYAYNLTFLNISANPLGEHGDDVLAPVAQLYNLEELQIHSAGLRDAQLQPLQDLPALGWLSLHGNALHGLEPLATANFPALHTLWLYFNQLESLEPIAHFSSLRNLLVHGNRLEDTRPLAALSHLRILVIGENPLRDLSGLSALHELEELHMYSNGIDSLEPIAGLRKLRVLRVYDNAITDLSPLSGMPELSELSLWGNAVQDIRPLRGLSLRRLHLDGNPVSDISSLADMHGMHHLDLAHSMVSDISPLAGMDALVFLDIGGTKVRDLTPLATLGNLETLDLSALELETSAMQVLADKVSLQNLQLGSNRLYTIEFLRNLTALKHVNLFSNHLHDLSPLLDNPGIGQEDTLNVAGNDWLLVDTSEVRAQIQTLETRGVQVTVEDLEQLAAAEHRMFYRTDDLALDAYIENNDNTFLARVRHANPDDPAQWFEHFPAGSYRMQNGDSNPASMLRVAGTTLCLSGTPYTWVTASFYRCTPYDMLQQWELEPLDTDTVMLRLFSPTQQELRYCLNAYQPEHRTMVNMYPCTPGDEDQIWRVVGLEP